MKKYEFIGIEHDGLKQIRALRDFGTVKAGDLGGWIESESNLSHEGNCWVFGNAQVFGNARVYGNAEIYDNARVYDNAEIYRNACVYGNAQVFGNARVYGDARVYGNMHIRVGQIRTKNRIIQIGPIGSRNDFTTFVKSDDEMYVTCGCFSGTIAAFEKAVKATHINDSSLFYRQYMHTIAYVKQMFSHEVVSHE